MKRKIFVRLVLPLAALAARILPRLRPAVEKKIIEINNRLTRASLTGARPSSLMLLLPHCLQFDECPHKITSNVLNCRACGKCDVASLLSLEGKFGIIIKIAAGGRLAKKLVDDAAADVVVAVACERELIEGIAAVWPSRVYAVENFRPQGPCVNTRVDAAKLRAAVESFLSQSPDFHPPEK